MRLIQTCFGKLVGNQNQHNLPMLIAATESTAVPVTSAEDDNSRSRRLFGRSDVRMSRCAGPCAQEDVIEMAFNGAAVAL